MDAAECIFLEGNDTESNTMAEEPTSYHSVCCFLACSCTVVVALCVCVCLVFVYAP